jgi:hypothetical protein
MPVDQVFAIGSGRKQPKAGHDQQAHAGGSRQPVASPSQEQLHPAQASVERQTWELDSGENE